MWRKNPKQVIKIQHELSRKKGEDVRKKILSQIDVRKFVKLFFPKTKAEKNQLFLMKKQKLQILSKVMSL